MRKFTVLITGVGSTTGISVIKGLRLQSEFDVRIVGVDINAANTIAGAGMCDAFCQVPPASDVGYVDAIASICRDAAVEVIFPIVDPELLALAEHWQRFAELGVSVIVSDASVVRRCNDKFATFQFMREHRIPTPETWLASEIEDPAALPYPIFVKPRHGVSSIDAFAVQSQSEFEAARQRIPDLIAQELLVGDEFTIDVLCDFAGRAIASTPRLRIQTKAGICTKGRTMHDESLCAWGVRIAEALGIRGPANIQCKRNGDDVSFFEVNPRFSAGLPLTINAGVNAPLWILKLVDGQSRPPGLLPFHGVVMARYWAEVFYRDADPVELIERDQGSPEDARR